MQNCVGAGLDVPAFSCYGHENVNTDGYPYLGFDGVFTCPVERFDAQMLLDPFEEQFNLPTGSVKFCDDQGWKREVIGEKHQRLMALLVPVPDTAKNGWVPFGRVEPLQGDGLISSYAVGFIHSA